MAEKSFGVKDINLVGATGTPTLESNGDLNITAGHVAIQTNTTLTGVCTATGFKTNSTVGDGSDVGFAIKYYVTADGSSAFRFAGPGLLNTTNNPTIYVQRGFTYIFENSNGGTHPFRIQFAGTGTGVGTYVSGSQSGTQVFTIPHDAPSSYQYQCTIHGSMLGTFSVV
tara:strand:- start:321 stop:827 length:507 start_codon:yes stop_codon:yes gene_type:complete